MKTIGFIETCSPYHPWVPENCQELVEIEIDHSFFSVLEEAGIVLDI